MDIYCMRVTIPIFYFQVYLVVLLAEWLVFSRYLYNCVTRSNTRHPLCVASTGCWVVVVLELGRVGLILGGVLQPQSHYFLVWLLEHVPFIVVGYEITKKHVVKVLWIFWNL